MCGWVWLQNGYEKDNCFEEIELCAQNMIIVLSSKVNIIGRVYMTTKWAWESSLWYFYFYFNLKENAHTLELWKLWRKWRHPRLGFANHLVLCRVLAPYFISFEVPVCTFHMGYKRIMANVNMTCGRVFFLKEIKIKLYGVLNFSWLFLNRLHLALRFSVFIGTHSVIGERDFWAS